MTLPYSDYSSLWLWWPYFCFSGSSCKAVLTHAASSSGAGRPKRYKIQQIMKRSGLSGTGSRVPPPAETSSPY